MLHVEKIACSGCTYTTDSSLLSQHPRWPTVQPVHVSSTTVNLFSQDHVSHLVQFCLYNRWGFNCDDFPMYFQFTVYYSVITQCRFYIYHGSHMKEVIDLTSHSSGDNSTEEVGLCFAILGHIWCWFVTCYLFDWFLIYFYYFYHSAWVFL